MQILNGKSKCKQENLKVATLCIKKKKKVTVVIKKDLMPDKSKGCFF